jgi:hypothetical protein
MIQGEKIRFPDFEIGVLQMVGPRIELVRVKPFESTSATNPASYSG